MNRLLRVKSTMEAIDRANEALHESVLEGYPVGCAIQWSIGVHDFDGHVERHGYGDRILVRNSRTDKPRWITSYNFRS